MFSVNTVIGQPGSFEKDRLDASADYRWPQDSLQYVPDWVYTSPEIYQREVKRIFHGPTWNFVALEAEIPHPGDYKRSYVGPTPVVVARDKDGSVHVFENRCAHRGAEFCRSQRVNTRDFVCPYHQQSYDLRGNLQGVPFKRGLRKEGGGNAGRLQEFGARPHQAARGHPAWGRLRHLCGCDRTARGVPLAR